MDLNNFDLYYQLFDYSLQTELNLRRRSLFQRELNLLHQIEHLPYENNPLTSFPKFTIVDQQIQLVSEPEFETGDLLTGLDIAKTESAIVALARFHASSIRNLDLLNEIMPFTRIDPQIEESVKHWMVDQLISLPDCDYFESNEQALRNFWEKASFADGHLDGDANLPTVLCHGNLSTENIWFRREKSSGNASISEEGMALIVHWDLARPGNGLSDLAHLLLSSVNSSIRLNHLDYWLGFYVHVFEQECQLLGVKKKRFLLKRTKPSMEQWRKCFRGQLKAQLARVLPTLAWHYRKLMEDKWVTPDEADEFESKKCALTGRMVGGFEMVKKEFEG